MTSDFACTSWYNRDRKRPVTLFCRSEPARQKKKLKTCNRCPLAQIFKSSRVRLWLSMKDIKLDLPEPAFPLTQKTGCELRSHFEK